MWYDLPVMGENNSWRTFFEMETSIPDATPASVRIGATRLRPMADVMLLIVAFVSFSWGIWNARVGLGDDTGPVLLGLHAAETREYPRDLYVLCYTLLLRWVSPDPIGAAIVMRSAVSLFTTLALFYVLSSFRPHLHRAAVLTACAVWLASQLNAPLVQHENSSTFAFGIAAVGLGWLLRRRSWTGFIGFAVAVSCAALDRPEYFAPALLIGAVSGVWLLRQTFKTRPSLFWSALAAGLALVVIAILPIFQWRSFGRSQNQMSMDTYLLVGFGQCYAVFYNKEHPEVALEPWTEYREVFDEKFGRPTTFLGAIRNNPREAFRYFALNTLQNLRVIPRAMLKTRQKEEPKSELIDRVPKLFLLTGLLTAGTLLTRRIFVAGRGPKRTPWKESVRRFQQEHRDLLWQIMLVAMFATASSVAIIIFIPQPRYWISCVPLVYLIVAACFDSLLRLEFLRKRPWLLWMPALILFCRPLFLGLGPNQNSEVNALRQIAPRLPENPVLAGMYTLPYQAYAFRGHAVSVNAGQGLSAEGIRKGSYDVLIVDDIMRASDFWSKNRDFFEAFQADPASSGYVKLTEATARLPHSADAVYTGRCDIYYRPRNPANPP
jgi:hypothetical protein